MRAAALAIEALEAGHRFDAALHSATRNFSAASRAASRDMASAAARQLGTCRALSALLSQRPPALPVAALQWLALSQLIAPRRRAATIVDQAVSAARADLRTAAAASFLNATLRTFERDSVRLLERAREQPEGRWNYPQWWIDVLSEQEPGAWQEVLAAGDLHPPLTLRINRRRSSVNAYLQGLAGQARQAQQVGESAVVVSPACPVDELPGWHEGLVSVQDEGAQRAALWLDVADGHRVLDACAAPGGKSAHLLEIAHLQLTSLEIDPTRLEQMRLGLERLGLAARLICGDAARPRQWWDGERFDRILVDAPCSASGIVRRAPDARWLRRRSDLATFARTQRRILEGLWPLLLPGGKLLYVTCSVFDAEGRDVARSFLDAHAEAFEIALPGSSVGARPRPGPGLQLLPVSEPARNHDGFYYCLIGKRQP